MWQLLTAMENAEMAAAKVYAWFAEAFSQDEELRFFFYKMQVEEKAHLALVRFVKRLYKQNPKLFTLTALPNLCALEKAKARADEVLALATISEKDALEFATELEVTLEEGYSNLATFNQIHTQPEILRLVRSLGGDKSHSESVTTLAKQRGIVF